MAVAKKWKWVTASGSMIDLTSVTINAEAAATATPRQGGFVLRNRWNASNLSSTNKNLYTTANLPDASSSSEPVNRMKILEVPDRTYVKDLTLFAIKSQTAPGLTWTPINTLAAGDLSTTNIYAGAYQNSKHPSASSYAAASHLVQITAVNSIAEDGQQAKKAEVFGHIEVTAKTIVLTHLMRSVDASIASNTKPMATAQRFGELTGSSTDGNNDTMGNYFPYGGYVYLAVGPYNTNLGTSNSMDVTTDVYASAAGATLDFAGTWEVQAMAQYVPE